MSQGTTITSNSLEGTREPAGPARRVQLVFLAAAEAPDAVSSSHTLEEIDEVRFRRGDRAVERTSAGGQRVLTLAFPDARMSSSHGRLFRGPTGWVLDDPASKNGAVVDGALTRRAVLGDGAVIELGRSFFVFRTTAEASPLPAHLTGDVAATDLPAMPRGLATFVPALARDYAALARLAPAAVSVVLLGETGTGKEVVARALHELSGRPGPFVAVNCGALPATLIEAELFGHRKGAFSGAVGDRTGLIRAADRGTLFLDEIGELPAGSQTAFLRALQEQEVVPVGDDRPVKVDIRLCAATLRDLEAAVEAGTFRADLYARILGHVITLPPLRERREDLGLILSALRTRVPGCERVTFASAALRALVRHDWPRNVRELEKVLASASALAGGEQIELEHLPPALGAGRRATPPPDPTFDDEDRALREQLIALFAAHDGNVVAVAEAMGKQRAQIYKWVKRLAIDLDGFRRE